MTSNTFTQKDQDFADAMATKLRLNREKLKRDEEANNKINNLTDQKKEKLVIFDFV